MSKHLAAVSAAVALVALVAFPLVVVAMVVALVAGAVLLTGEVPVVPQALGWTAFSLGAALVVAALAAVRARPAPAEGPELTRAEHPALLAQVDEVAAALGTAPPDRVVVDLDVNASVVEVAGRREMVLGLPLLAGLSRAELRAVVAHELGHLEAGHTRATRSTRAAHRAATLLDGVLDEVPLPVRLLLLPHALLYALLASPATRAQELAADELSVRAVGAEASVSALRRGVALDLAWDRYVEDYLPLSVPARRRPELVAGFTALLRDDATALEEATRAVLATGARTPLLDTHPSLDRRTAHLRSTALAAPAPREGDDEPALSLLGGADALTALEAALLEGTPVHADDPVADWDELVDAAWRATVAEDADALVRAGGRSGLTVTGTPAAVLDAVAAGHGLRLAAAVEPRARGDERWEVLRVHLVGLASQVLADAGRARAEVCWTGEWQVREVDPEGRSGGLLDLDALVEPVLRDPAAGTAQLVRSLTARGGDLTAAARRPVQALRPQVVGALSQLSAGRRRRCDAVVALDGLVLLPSPRLPWWAGLLEPVAARRVRARAEALLDAEATALVAEGGRWVPAADVRTASLGLRPWGWTLRLELEDGESLTVRTTQRTEDAGDAHEGLAALVATRSSKTPGAPDHRAGDLPELPPADGGAVPEPV
ncbi:M48 family metallopeptidase [uncultured Pseudokineococcus sp.]|uniref:M48 family metallopeptidase n=1 Tax=uncultured Pseudokineococcus sp. TaxID=1642928 RepID=UPI002627091F|nr:M48 family metallopeptidase [uncultured Pseudokineococcus sp.]